MPEEIAITSICEHMHWTYQEYMEQPLWLIEALGIKLEEDSKAQDK